MQIAFARDSSCGMRYARFLRKFPVTPTKWWIFPILLNITRVRENPHSRKSLESEWGAYNADIAKFAMIIWPWAAHSIIQTKNHLELRLDVIQLVPMHLWAPEIWTCIFSHCQKLWEAEIKRWNIHDAPLNRWYNLHSWIPWPEKNLSLSFSP